MKALTVEEIEKILIDSVHPTMAYDTAKVNWGKLAHAIHDRLPESLPKITKEELLKIANIPSDEEIKKSPAPNYARAYYQGRFDLIMELELRKCI